MLLTKVLEQAGFGHSDFFWTTDPRRDCDREVELLLYIEEEELLKRFDWESLRFADVSAAEEGLNGGRGGGVCCRGRGVAVWYCS